MNTLNKYKLNKKIVEFGKICIFLSIEFSKIIVFYFFLITAILFWQNSALQFPEVAQQISQMLLIVIILVIILMIDRIIKYFK